MKHASMKMSKVSGTAAMSEPVRNTTADLAARYRFLVVRVAT